MAEEIGKVVLVGRQKAVGSLREGAEERQYIEAEDPRKDRKDEDMERESRDQFVEDN
jgi:hypothetical protein